MSKGYVYILTNEAMPGLVKIGKTTRDPERRAAELQQTGVPFAFVVAFSVFSPNCHELEADIHRCLPDLRVSPDREFFRCDVDLARSLLEECHAEQVDLWLSEFLPDHRAVQEDFSVDMGRVEYLANAHDLHPIEVVHAFQYLNAAEIAPAINRMFAVFEERRKKRLNGEDMQ